MNSDTVLCENIACPLNSQCFRYTTAPGEGAIFTTYAPGPDGECRYYIPIIPDSENAGACAAGKKEAAA